MIAISYYYHRSERFVMEVFKTEEQAKQWFIRECIDNKIADYWCDEDDNEYCEAHEIEACLQKLSLSDIIEGMQGAGDIEVKFIIEDC